MLVEQISGERNRLHAEVVDLRAEIRFATPRNAELEQAARNAKDNGTLSVLGITVGTGLLSLASLCESVACAMLVGIGIASTALGLLLLARTNQNGWPVEKPRVPRD